MSGRDLEDYRHLPVETAPDAFWIAAVLRMPAWVDRPPPNAPYRPYCALVLTEDLGIAMSELVADRAAADRLLLPTLVKFATGARVGIRPLRIATDRDDTAEHLRAALGDLVEGVKVADLPPLSAMRQQLADMPGASNVPAALSVPGVTREDVRAFAAAAADFHRAAPWRHLDDHDLIHVESPRSSPGGQKYVVVMGGGGRTFGLAFYASRERYQLTMDGPGDSTEFLRAPEPLFSVTFNAAHQIAFGDHDLWEDENLPLAGPDAYPFAALYDPLSHDVIRPNAALLNHAQAVLATLAATTEQDMDTGRWTKIVPTLDGPAPYTLAIPSLLKASKKRSSSKPTANAESARRMLERAMNDIATRIQESGPQTTDEINRLLERELAGGAAPGRSRRRRRGAKTASARERAADLLEQALEACGRRQIQLAREALELDPDNADALDILARRAGDPEQRLALYRQALDAGRRAIGDEFDSLVGHFWGFVQTRPYMRARVGLAMALRDLGRHQEALDHFLEMLRLNPNDNQGIRDLVPATLLALGRNQDVLDFTRKHGRDDAVPAYAAALATFRLKGNSADARKDLAHAVRVNPHVPHHLARDTRPESESEFGYSPGRPSEAIYCLDELGVAWRATPGAVQWIAAALPPPATRKRRRSR